MVPYRGRFALRIARMVLAAACLVSYVRSTGWRFTWIVALLAAYLVYAIGSMFEVRFDSTLRTNLGLVIDTAYFGFWTYLAPGGWIGSTPAGWMSALDGSYLFASVVLLQEVSRVVVVAIDHSARFAAVHASRRNVAGLDRARAGLRFHRTISL